MGEFCPIYNGNTNNFIGMWAKFPVNIRIEGLMELELNHYAQPMRDALINSPTRIVQNDRTDVGRGVVFLRGAFVMLDDNRAPSEDLRDLDLKISFELRNQDGVPILWRDNPESREKIKKQEGIHEQSTDETPTKESILLRLRETMGHGSFSPSIVEQWGDSATIKPILESIRDNKQTDIKIAMRADTFVRALDRILSAADTQETKTGRDQGICSTDERKKTTIETELFAACVKGNTTEVENILNTKKFLFFTAVNVNALDEDGWTALMFASSQGHKDVVELLLQKGANLEAINQNSWTSLMIASSEGHKGVVQLLIKKGANLEAVNEHNRASLMFASHKGHKEVVELLIKNGADLEAVNDTGRTSLMIASSHGHKEVIELLIKNGANLEAVDNTGQTSLMYASSNGHKQVADLLIRNGANEQDSSY